MAEELGSASLRIDVDIEALRNSLNQAKSLVEKELGGTIGRTTRAAAPTAGRVQRGRAENIRALEIAQEKRFRLARRIDTLEERGADVARLRARLGALTDSQSRRQFGTFRQISQELARQVTLEERRLLSARRAERAVRQGAGGFGGKGGAAESVFALERAQDRRFRLNRQITLLEERGANVSRLRAALGKLTEAQSAREYENQRRQAVQLSRLVRLEGDRFKRTQARSRAELQEGLRIGRLNASPVTGRTAAGAIPGSPAALAAELRQQRQIEASQRRAAAEQLRTQRERVRLARAELAEGLRIGRLNASPVTGRTPTGAIPGSPAALQEQARQQRQAEAAQRRTQREQEAQQRRLAAERRRADQQQQREARAQLNEGLRIGRLNASPVRGGVAFPGSPIALEKAAAAERKLARERDRAAASTLKAAERERTTRANRRRDIAANALIGAGFPLLFGQGAGAAAGGAIGGALGALGGGTFGFAGSIVGTAVGAAFDTALQKGQELARGLDDPIKNFEALRQAALLSSKAVEKNAEALIAAGREEEAAALLRQDLLKTFGTTAGYEEFAKASDELNRSFSQATVALAQFVAGPLADFLNTLATGLGGGANIRFAQENAGRVRELIQGDPQLERRFRQLAQQRGLSLGQNLEVNSRDLAARNQLVEEFLRLNGEQTAQQKQQAQNEKEMNAAIASGNTLKALSAKLALEQARGNELSAAQTERQLLAAEKQSKLNLLPRTATQTQRRLVAESFTEREVANAERIRAAQDSINAAAFQEQQRRREINTSITNTFALLGAQSGQYRDTLRTIQSINASIEESRRKEAELGFQIDRARQAGQEETAAALVDRQRTAAEETRLQLVQGALALTEASERLRDNLSEATLNFVSIRQDAQGLNRFLSGADVQRRAEQDFQLLLPQFRQAQAIFASLTGARAPEFQGPTAGVNAAIIDFVNSVNREQTARRELAGTQTGLEAVNTALADVTRQLYGATTELVNKNWTIDIQVVNQAGGASTVNAVNSLAQ